MAIKCLGTSADCHDDNTKYFKPDRTICGGGTLLCINGSCELSICALHSLLPCQLKEPETKLCTITCLKKDGSCVPYYTIDTNTVSSKTLYLPCKK